MVEEAPSGCRRCSLRESCHREEGGEGPGRITGGRLVAYSALAFMAPLAAAIVAAVAVQDESKKLPAAVAAFVVAALAVSLVVRALARREKKDIPRP